MRSIKLYNESMLLLTITVILTASVSRLLPFSTVLFITGIGCCIAVAIQQHANKVYQLECKTIQEEIEQMKTQLLDAQKPDKTSLRAKELLPVGNTFLIQAADTIRKKIDIAGILEFINKIMIEQLFADGGVILTIGEFEDVLSVKAYKGNYPPPYKLPEDVPHTQDKVIANFKYAEFPLKASFFGTAVLSAKPILIQNAQSDSRIAINGDEPFLRHGSLLTLPMVYHDSVTGIISLSRNPEHEPFTPADIEIGEILTGYATAALKLVYDLQEEHELNTIENEMDIASKIQKLLLPKKLLDIPHLDFSVLFNQARGVCSDYYDVIHGQQNRFFYAIADIAGKSIHACVVMVMIRTLLYLITETTQNTQNILDTLNKGMTGKISIDHYASVSLLSYTVGTKTIEYVNAGRQSLLLWKNKIKKVQLLEQKTDPIGIDVKSTYTCKKIPVEKDDIAVLFSDGLVETLDRWGKPFGIKTLAKLIAEYHTFSAKEMVKKINKDIKTFIGNVAPHDDQTMIIIKVK